MGWEASQVKRHLGLSWGLWDRTLGPLKWPVPSHVPGQATLLGKSEPAIDLATVPTSLGGADSWQNLDWTAKGKLCLLGTGVAVPRGTFL